METGLATGWCDRRAERDSTLRLALRGEADRSSLLEGAWAEGRVTLAGSLCVGIGGMTHSDSQVTPPLA